METNEVKITRKWYTQFEKQQIIDHWKESGKSKREYCHESGVNYYTLMKGLSRKRKHKSPSSKRRQSDSCFLQVKLPPASTGNPFVRIYIGKTTVDLYDPVSSDFLFQLLRS